MLGWSIASSSKTAPHSKLLVLNLERNDFREGGLIAISEALGVNSTLQELRLAQQKHEQLWWPAPKQPAPAQPRSRSDGLSEWAGVPWEGIPFQEKPSHNSWGGYPPCHAA